MHEVLISVKWDNFVSMRQNSAYFYKCHNSLILSISFERENMR